MSLSNSGYVAGYDATVTDNGQYVAFLSRSQDIVEDKTNSYSDIFVRDRVQGTITRVSLNWEGNELEKSRSTGSNNAYYPSISGNGKHVAFVSKSNNVVEGDENDEADLFIRDLNRQETVQINVYSDGTPGSLFLTEVRGLSLTTAGLIISGWGFGGFVGQILLPALSDYWGRKPVIILSTIINGLAVVWFTIAGDSTILLFGILFLSGIFGFGISLFTTVCPVKISSLICRGTYSYWRIF